MTNRLGPEFARYLVVGSVMTALSYAVVRVSAALGFHYLIAVSLGWLIPVLVGYVAHGHFTFGREAAGPSATVRLLRHLSAGLVQWAVVCIGYVVAISGFGLGLDAAFLVNSMFGAVVGFVAMRWGVFTGRRRTVHGRASV